MTPHPQPVIPDETPKYHPVLLRSGPSLGPRTNFLHLSASPSGIRPHTPHPQHGPGSAHAAPRQVAPHPALRQLGRPRSPRPGSPTGLPWEERAAAEDAAAALLPVAAGAKDKLEDKDNDEAGALPSLHGTPAPARC